MIGKQLFTVTVTTASLIALQLVSSVTSLNYLFVNIGFISPALARTVLSMYLLVVELPNVLKQVVHEDV